MRKALALLAAVASAVAVTASIGVPVASANGICPTEQYASYSKLSNVGTSYSGTLRLKDADDTGGSMASFAVGGSTYYIRAYIKKVPGNGRVFAFGVESNNGDFSEDYFFVPVGVPQDATASYTVSKDGGFPTWSGSVTVSGISTQALSFVDLGGAAQWTEARSWIPVDFPCHNITADVSVTGVSLPTWTFDSNLGAYYQTKLLNSNTLFRTVWVG